METSRPKHLDNVWMYLRKSREDRDAEERARREGRSEIETLTRHRQTLLDIARRRHWNVTNICEEVVSGEYISERPAVQRLLHAIEDGEAEAVLVMDIDRLGRGDMEDQGRILRTFREAAAVILTPDKIYDLSNEMDEEWTEFKAFFARRELKMITKRMQRGRQASVAEGKYIATRPPFGYDVNEDLILVPNGDADTVRLIFDLHVHHDMGGGRIAHYLNSLGIQSPMGKTWRSPNVIALLRNEHYAGYIVWRKIKIDRRKHTRKKRPDEDVLRVKGKHEPLVSEALFCRSAEIRASRSHTPAGLSKGIQNPLAGLIICGKCGESMVRRPNRKQKPHLMCKNPSCAQRSTRLEFVEERIIHALREWVGDYRELVNEMASRISRQQKPIYDPMSTRATILATIEEDLRQLNLQRNELHDLLERKIYDADTYLMRNQILIQRLNELQDRKSKIEDQFLASKKTYDTETIIPMVTHALDSYRHSENPANQHQLLSSILERAVYNKESWQRADDFELQIYPAIR